MILLPQLSRFQTCECLDWSLCHLRACQDQHLSAHARWQPETAARALRVTPFTVDRLIRSQSLPFFKVPGHNRLWIDRAAVEQLATAAGKIGGQP